MTDLTPEQRAVVHADVHALAVAAGAGTGKTFTVAHRVRHLVRERAVSPHRVLVVTFTREATASLARRLNLLLGRDHGVEVRSFHSFAAREMPDVRNFLEPREARHIVKRACVPAIGRGEDGKRLERLLRGGSGDVDDLHQRVLSFVSYCKNAEVSPQEAVRSQLTSLAGHEAALSEMYDAYVEGQEGRLDFDDLVLVFRNRLRDDAAFRDAVAERLDHLLVDEYQDVNRAQHEVVLLLTRPETGKHRPKVAVVGDERQAIYGFRGSAPGHLEGFPQAYADGLHERLPLTLNFRSQPEVLDRANNLFPASDPLRPGPDAPTGAPPAVVACASADEEGRLVAERIETLLEGGEDPSEIAVLFRSRHLASGFEEEVAKRVGEATRAIKYKKVPRGEGEARLALAEAVASVVRLTVHAAKGLEWDHVFLLGAHEGGLPSAPTLAAPDEARDALLSEEKRLFYVAATRPRKSFLVTHLTRKGGKAVAPSRFLTAYSRPAAPEGREAATA